MEAVKKFLDGIKDFGPDPEIKFGDPGMMIEMQKMGVFRELMGYHFPSFEGIQGIADAVPKCYPEGETGPLLCVGSGKALTEKVISLTETEVIATDPGLSHGSESLLTDKYWPLMDMEILTASEAVEKYSNANCFMIVWPTFNGEWTGEFVEKIVEKKNPLTRIIHIGEGEGECTGNDKFHDLLSENFELESVIWGKRWVGIHDRVQIWGPKTPDSGEEE